MYECFSQGDLGQVWPKGGSMSGVTTEMVAQAYDALSSGDRARIEEYWHADMVWLVPGHNRLSGLYRGLDRFLGFMGTVGALSKDSFRMERTAIMLANEHSADVTRNVGYRDGDEAGQVPYRQLDIDVVHVLRWRDGKVIEGRGAIFGDGSTEYDQFWSNVGTSAPLR